MIKITYESGDKLPRTEGIDHRKMNDTIESNNDKSAADESEGQEEYEGGASDLNTSRSGKQSY